MQKRDLVDLKDCSYKSDNNAYPAEPIFRLAKAAVFWLLIAVVFLVQNRAPAKVSA